MTDSRPYELALERSPNERVDGRFRTASNRPTEDSVVDPDDLEYADDRASVVAIGAPSVDAVAPSEPET